LPFVVDLPDEQWGFSIVMLVYQRVSSIETYVHPPSATSGYAAIGEDLVAGVDAAERRKVFSRVGAGGLGCHRNFQERKSMGNKKKFSGHHNFPMFSFFF